MPNILYRFESSRVSEVIPPLLLFNMPVPWEALIPFGEAAYLPTFLSDFLRDTRSGNRDVRYCWNSVEYL